MIIRPLRRKGRGLISPAPEKAYNPNMINIMDTIRPETVNKIGLFVNSGGAPKYRLHSAENEITAWNKASNKLIIPADLKSIEFEVNVIYFPGSGI